MSAQFSGEPATIWRTEKDRPDRGMTLTVAFWFCDRGRRRWDAAQGTTIDGASIPRALWALVGSPYTGDYRRASIVHDVACVAAGPGDGPARRDADRMFFEACREGGCSVRQSIILYVGVRIGAWYGNALVEQLDESARIVPTQLDRQLQADFQEIAERVLAAGEVDDAADVERRTDAAFATVAAQRVAAADALMSAPARLGA